ncbi:hypothetical protein OG292_00220 [Streptomyces sp. NBC_01511]|uniref:hypothetical protein n=1 Tax=Streptomyces sp. NBC_01511 TaxID=2903889 RepID=UPI00386EE13F
MAEADPAPAYRALLDAVDRLGLLYLHLTDNDRCPALAGLVPYGRSFIANPDLPERFACGAPLNTTDERHFCAHGGRGRTHHPALRLDLCSAGS